MLLPGYPTTVISARRSINTRAATEMGGSDRSFVRRVGSLLRSNTPARQLHVRSVFNKSVAREPVIREPVYTSRYHPRFTMYVITRYIQVESRACLPSLTPSLALSR